MIEEILRAFCPDPDPMCGVGGLLLPSTPSTEDIVVFVRDTRDLRYLQELANSLGCTVAWCDPIRI